MRFHVDIIQKDAGGNYNHCPNWITDKDDGNAILTGDYRAYDDGSVEKWFDAIGNTKSKWVAADELIRLDCRKSKNQYMF